ncbi:MAG: pilus assembly protein PilX [Thiohalocapsa sp.]|jgi:type IV pilus assembly protein PilX|uniref:pilus assembly PilX family protein n=1 Tax=Thiohalocapsa sp. TaxID=2497641 RepID=UPI0025E8D16B|nr:PilX N-terminal domain-containing pilus assembly protein [Thiohalocapsa sp.]MCG6940551.1 pilus assembly protein PilX [Thiohalocapsa sp.]
MPMTPRHINAPGRGPRQQGVALAVGLILLVVITLLSLAGVRNTGMQERMASNLRDRNLAFQSAESALRAAEAALVVDAGSSAASVADPGDPDYWNDCWEGVRTDCPPAVVHTVDTDAWGIAASPEYRIEHLRAGNYGSLAADEALSSAGLYRITVRAVGGTTDAVVLLQSTFRP